MKKFLKSPETLLIALAFLLFGFAVMAGCLPEAQPQGNKVIYVSDEDKENLLTNGTAESVIINLNTATLEELCLLEGVDTVTAQAIIDYRAEKGKIENFEDLLDIKGIGEVKYRIIKAYTTLE